MKTNETLKLLDDKDLLDKIYHFSYHRCNTSFEAEDLCSDIILAVYRPYTNKRILRTFMPLYGRLPAEFMPIIAKKEMPGAKCSVSKMTTRFLRLKKTR